LAPAWPARVALITEGQLWQGARCARYVPCARGGCHASKLIAGLRAANARLRKLLAGQDAQIAELLVRVEQISQLEAVVAECQAQVSDLAARSGKNLKNSSKPPSSDAEQQANFKISRQQPEDLSSYAACGPAHGTWVTTG
jgi:Family of unknown function (DUF6444)